MYQKAEAATFGLKGGNEDLAATILSWYREADDYFQESYPERQRYFDYFDNKQFDNDELAELDDRGQPATIINKVRVAVELIMGTYDKTRMDMVFQPRSTHDDDWQTAEALTHGSKFIEDVNDTVFKNRKAFRDMVIGGLGIVEECLTRDPTEEEICERYVDWRQVRLDPYSREEDYSDGRYFFRVKWMDLDEAKTLWPDHVEKLEEAASHAAFSNAFGTPMDEFGDYGLPNLDQSSGAGAAWHPSQWIDSKRNRILMLECWYRKYDRATFLRDRRTGRVIEFNAKTAGRAALQLYVGGISGQLPVDILRDRPIKRVRLALMAGPHLLEDVPSPYNHNRIPFALAWGWRDSRTGQPSGIVKPLMDPQDAGNKALQKLVLAISTNQVIMEEKAGDAEVLRQEASRPDGFLVVGRDALAKGRIQINRNDGTAKQHMAIFDMFDRVASELAGGLELQGLASNADSGRAIALRQEQGHTTLSTLFENFRFFRKQQALMRLSNIQQFWPDDKSIRLTEQFDPDRREVVILNQVMPDGTIRNDANSIRCDVVMDEQTARASVRQLFADKLMDFILRIDPMIGMSLMDLVVDGYDLPNRPMVKRRIQEAMMRLGLLQPAQGGPMQAGDTAQSAGLFPPDLPPGGEGAGFSPDVMGRLAAGDAGGAVNNKGR